MCLLCYLDFRLSASLLRLNIFTMHSTVHRDPVAVSKAYTPDSIWRNRDRFLQGTDAIIAFLTNKWEKEQGYKLRKELFAWTGNKIAVQVRHSHLDFS